ncbi:MAG: hypothetical protein ACON3Z_13640 [Bradymonadia bacterium]
MSILSAISVPVSDSYAQTLDLAAEARLGTGALVSSGEGETAWGRAPTNLQFDVGLVFDDDKEFEWVLGGIVQLERQVVLGINPKIRLVRELGRADVRFFAGLPWYVAPVRRLGAELGGGLHLPVNEFFGWVGILSVQGFFAGADVPDGQTVLAINGAFGVRLVL